MRVILSLEPKDMFDGPEPDRDPRYSEKWTVAEFSPEHERDAVLEAVRSNGCGAM